jgi:putative copper export protein
MTATAVSAPLLAVNLLAGAVWVGSLAALTVVTRTARQTLEPQAQVTFFRALGRRYGIVGTGALAVAIATGAGLLSDQRWTGQLTALAALTAALVLVTALGMRQARRVNRLRARRDDTAAAERAARRAGLLRAAIALLTLAIVIDVALYLTSS